MLMFLVNYYKKRYTGQLGYKIKAHINTWTAKMGTYSLSGPNRVTCVVNLV